MIVVQRQRALVAVCREEIGGLAMNERWSPCSCMISRDPALHLYDVRTEVTEEHRAIWASQRFGEFNHPDGFEYWMHSGILSRSKLCPYSISDMNKWVGW